MRVEHTIERREEGEQSTAVASHRALPRRMEDSELNWCEKSKFSLGGWWKEVNARGWRGVQ